MRKLKKENISDKNFFEREIVICIVALICCFLWGSAFPFIKIGYRIFQINSSDTGTQILFAGLRFAIAGGMVILFGSIQKKKLVIPKYSDCPKIFYISMLQTVGQYIFFYIGLAHSTGVKSSIVLASNVFIAIIISSLIFKQEKMNTVKVIGCIMGFLGVVIVNLNGGSFDFAMSLNGEGCILLSTIAYCLAAVVLKSYGPNQDVMMISGYQFLLGGIIMIIAGTLSNGRLTVISAEGILLLTYLALVSAVAYTLWSLLLRYNDVSKVAVYGFMNPVFGVVLSTLLLKEGSDIWNIRSLVALLLVCGGIIVVNKKKGINVKEQYKKER